MLCVLLLGDYGSNAGRASSDCWLLLLFLCLVLPSHVSDTAAAADDDDYDSLPCVAD
jgi:hypothetical protein